VLVITHYQRLLEYIKPGFVHVMLNGRIVANGGPELAKELDVKGYEWVRAEFAPEEAMTREEAADPALTPSQQSVVGRPVVRNAQA
jgi:Fe-S cluster assembly ATP-binding protein